MLFFIEGNLFFTYLFVSVMNIHIEAFDTAVLTFPFSGIFYFSRTEQIKYKDFISVNISSLITLYYFEQRIMFMLAEILKCKKESYFMFGIQI